MRREKGSIADMMAAGLCMLAMTAVMLAYMNNASMVFRKAEVNQLARKYILRMETVGRLTEEDRLALSLELENAGVTEPNLEGSTTDKVGYGEPVVLMIRGKLEGEYDFEEKRISTAKH